MTVLSAPEITAPSIAYGKLLPVIIVLGLALAGVIIEAFVPRRAREWAQVTVCSLGLIGAMVSVAVLAGTKQLVSDGAIAVDGPSLFAWGLLIGLGLLAVFLLAEHAPELDGGAIVAQAALPAGSREESRAAALGQRQTEVFPLAMFALAGMMLFAASNDLVLMFVALEVLSLPLYLMCGLARRRRLVSQEAALKYFLLGAFSSAFFLYGVANLYGYSGSTKLADIFGSTSAALGNDGLLYLGLGLIGVGMLFKIGAVPFHMWTPDVYQGAPTPVTAFMASATKAGAVVALLRIIYVAFPSMEWQWRPVLWGVAILTMVVGAILALTQRDIKRMLAYSAILNAGYLLTGVLAGNGEGISSSLFYLAAYGFATVAAFGLVMVIRDPDGEATHLSRLAGLGRTSPLVACSLAFVLLAFAGIPLTSGFTGKFALFEAAVAGGASPVVIVAVVASAISAFFYIRVIVLMFFNRPPTSGAPAVAVPSPLTSLAIALGVGVTLVLGVYPQPLLQLAHDAATFVQ